MPYRGAMRHFTAEVRVLLCEGCGAPLEVPIGGGQIPCSYCRVKNQVLVRDERPTLGMPAVPMPIDEGERLRRLRMQDGRPLLPPPALMALVPGGRIEPWREQEVFSVFQSTRKEVRATHSPDAAERLFFLTLVISNHLGSTRDDARLRAVLETSLDTLELPRHRQVLRGILSRNAVREGDLVAAERWLGPCDARSDDLESDSSFRISRALLHTARQDFLGALAFLGRSEAEVPIADSMDSSAAVLRANALEKSGDLEGAVRSLRERMGKAGPTGRQAIEAFVRLTPDLRLCEATLPRASAAHTEQAAKSAGGGLQIFGGIFMGVGALLLLLGLGLGAVLTGGSVLAGGMGGGMGLAAIPGLLGGALAGCGGPGLSGLVMLAIGFFVMRHGRASAELRRIGVPAHGTVLAIQPTGMRVNRVPVMALSLRVEREGVAPYEAKLNHTMQGHELAVGSRVALRVHPQNPSKLQLETD
jgi:LSD1 subclass zinc finger protein